MAYGRGDCWKCFVSNLRSTQFDRRRYCSAYNFCLDLYTKSVGIVVLYFCLDLYTTSVSNIFTDMFHLLTSQSNLLLKILYLDILWIHYYSLDTNFPCFFVGTGEPQIQTFMKLQIFYRAVSRLCQSTKSHIHEKACFLKTRKLSFKINESTVYNLSWVGCSRWVRQELLSLPEHMTCVSYNYQSLGVTDREDYVWQ